MCIEHSAQAHTKYLLNGSSDCDTEAIYHTVLRSLALAVMTDTGEPQVPSSVAL